MIVYIGILLVLITAIVLTANTLFGTFVRMRASEAIAQSSHLALERMTREVRAATSVHTGSSVLDVSPGTLVLNTEDSSGNPTTITFFLDEGRIWVEEASAAPIPLTHNSVTVTSLVFHRVQGTETEAMRISFTATKSVRGTTLSKDYRTFAVLDGI